MMQSSLPQRKVTTCLRPPLLLYWLKSRLWPLQSTWLHKRLPLRSVALLKLKQMGSSLVDMVELPFKGCVSQFYYFPSFSAYLKGLDMYSLIFCSTCVLTSSYVTVELNSHEPLGPILLWSGDVIFHFRLCHSHCHSPRTHSKRDPLYKPTH